MVEAWAPLIDAALRETAGQRNPSEWFKKEECWKELQNRLPALSDPLPPELSYGGQTGHAMAPAAATHSVADYERIERCMHIAAPPGLRLPSWVRKLD
jgi:hypothetical protein